METKDILLLLASFLIGYFAGLLTTYTAPPISIAFGKFKAASLNARPRRW